MSPTGGRKWPRLGAVTIAFLAIGPFRAALAHEPIFAPGAHVHSKNGQEITLQYFDGRKSGGGDKETEQHLALAYEYGVTSSLTVGVEAPLVRNVSNGNGSSGLGDITLGAKYRFLRIDKPGQQYSTTALFKIKLPTGDDGRNPRLGSGSTDFTGGLLHGLESRRWYYNTAARYRFNTEGGGGLRKGNKILLDLVAGVRPVLTKYKEPDTVLFLELNFEDTGRDRLNGVGLGNTGGRQLFLSPGIFWTYRTYAVTAGVQIPVAENLNGSQPETDYRFKLSTKLSF